MKSVAIMMSTYNGSLYIREQIESILIQKNVMVSIYIRDDGSSDDTINIISELCAVNKNIILFRGENVGVGNSFFSILKLVPNNFDYYAFADQDDIWLENKLYEAIDMLEQTDKVLYASNQECVDKYGNSLGLRYSKNQKINLSTMEIINKNMLAGCTMVFKKKLFVKIIETNGFPSSLLLKNRIHDVCLATAASLLGGIVYDNRSFIYYRQHENNVVGAYSMSFVELVKSRLKKIYHTEFRNGRSKLATELVTAFPNESSGNALLILCAEKDSFTHRLRLLKMIKEISIGNESENIMELGIKIILGLF